MSIVPKLSVGLPVYNRSAYVAESIEALLGQTFEDFELIISDNASTDDTGDICRRYEKLDSRIRYFRQQSYHHADRTIIAELALYGPFYQVPEWLYFRRDHPGRAERSHPIVRARCANMDPRRGNPWRNPVPRLPGRRAKPHPLVAAALPVAEAAPSIPVDELVAGRKESLS